MPSSMKWMTAVNVCELFSCLAAICGWFVPIFTYKHYAGSPLSGGRRAGAHNFPSYTPLRSMRIASVASDSKIIVSSNLA